MCRALNVVSEDMDDSEIMVSQVRINKIINDRELCDKAGEVISDFISGTFGRLLRVPFPLAGLREYTPG